jgi:hypothetical protein
MFRYCIFVLLIMSLVVPYPLLYAVTSEFTVRTLIGIDTTPPTTPTGLTATPVTYSQINLAWLPSTDDIMLSGYQVWRDAVQIATTTATTYVDTGLTASTTYTYTITAYDHVFNVSSSSVPVATTTPSIPVPPPTSTSTRGTQGGLRPFADILISLEILPQKDSVIIRHETNMFTRAVIKWGKTTSYELGSLAEQAFSKKHESRIVGLTPGTTYQFVIEGEDEYGRYGKMHVGTFTTLPPDDIFPPGNVTQLRGVREGNDIVLSWQLPEDPDLAYVRVVRNDRFYPSDIADGWVVYEGLARDFRDVGVGQSAQYYSVFSYDTLGNVSSGAVLLVRPVGSDTATTTPLPGEIDTTKNTIAISFSDVLFIQEGERLPSTEGRVVLNGSKQLTIAVPYLLVPEHLKTILVVIGDSTDPERTFQFLLRVNPERTYYTSTLAPLGVGGDFPFSIAIFDYTTAQIGYASGVLTSLITTIVTEVDTASYQSFFAYLLAFFTSYLFWFILFLMSLILMGWRLVRRKDEKEKKS